MSGGVEPTVHADAAASARTARRGGRRRAAAVLLVALAWAGAGNHLFERGGSAAADLVRKEEEEKQPTIRSGRPGFFTYTSSTVMTAIIYLFEYEYLHRLRPGRGGSLRSRENAWLFLFSHGGMSGTLPAGRSRTQTQVF
jgi:hypothetical protein